MTRGHPNSDLGRMQRLLHIPVGVVVISITEVLTINAPMHKKASLIRDEQQSQTIAVFLNQLQMLLSIFHTQLMIMGKKLLSEVPCNKDETWLLGESGGWLSSTNWWRLIGGELTDAVVVGSWLKPHSP